MNDAKASQRIGRLTPLADALAQIDQLVSPVAPKAVAISKAWGLTLAADVTAAQAHPAASLALRDGVALHAEATLDAGSYAPMPVEATVVEVGDPLPAGTDAIAPPETIEHRNGAVYAIAPVAPGDGVLPAGADVRAGEPLQRSGSRLRGSDLAGLAMAGVTGAQFYEPRVRVISASPNRHGATDAIAALLARAIHVNSRVAVEWPSGPHVPSLTRDFSSRAVDRIFLSEQTPGTDLGHALAPGGESALVVIGGSGSGRRDSSIHTLARFGRVVFHGVGLAPGETAGFGMIGERPVLVVPGRLDAAIAVWVTMGRRMLDRLCGYGGRDESMFASLTRKIASTLGLAEIVLVAREQDGIVPLSSGYLSLQSLARADGYVLVPADCEGYPAGTRVEMKPLP